MTTFLKPNMLGSPAIGAHNICRVQLSRNGRGDHVSGSTTRADFTDVRTGTRAQQTQLHLSPAEVGCFRLRLLLVPNSGLPEFGWGEGARHRCGSRSNAKAS